MICCCLETRLTCDLAAVLEINNGKCMHLSDCSKASISQSAASLQVQGCDTLQTVQGQEACVNERYLPAAIKGQGPASKNDVHYTCL